MSDSATEQGSFLPRKSSAQRDAASRTNLLTLQAMITSLMQQFWVNHYDSQTIEIMIGDWMIALKERPLAAIQAARAKWLQDPETGIRAPKIAEFIALVDDATPLRRGEMGKAPENLVPEPDGKKFSERTGPEKWSWYARAHAWCEATGNEPRFDMRKKFHDEMLVGQAAAELQIGNRSKLLDKIRRTRQGEAPAKHLGHYPPDAVRDHWRHVPANQLTDAERAIALPLVQELGRSLAGGLAAPNIATTRGGRVDDRAIIASFRPPAVEHVQPEPAANSFPPKNAEPDAEPYVPGRGYGS